MAVLTFSDEDINRMKKMSDGWHLVEITSITAKPNKDKTGENVSYEMKCVDENDTDNGLFAYRSYPSAYPSMHLSLIVAATGLTVRDMQAGEFDSDVCIGKRLYIKTGDSINPKTQVRTEGDVLEFANAAKVPLS